jgi:hypothetical protein
MPGSVFDLEKILDPITPEQFLGETWEKQPLAVHRKARDHFVALFSLANLDAVIAFSRPRFTDSEGFPGRPSSSETCVQGYLPDQLPAPTDVYPGIAELRQLYAQGKTVVIRGMQHRWPAIAALCRNLEAVFHCPVHGSLYLTPPNAQGFDAHIDPHEVFALQLDGVKHWRLYGPAAELPLPGDTASIPREQLGPPREVRLEPGDLHYIPRGHAHEAHTADQPSMHLTIGINIYRWVDLLQHALKEMSRRDPRLRESLPPGALLSSEIDPGLSGRFRELLLAVAECARFDDAARRLGDQFLNGLAMLPRDHFVSPAEVDSMNADTVLTKSPGAVCRCLVGPERALIQFPGGQVGGPARIGPALQFIAQTQRFAVRELPEGLGVNGKLVLVRRLVREGMLSVVQAERVARGIAFAACAARNGTTRLPEPIAVPM